jgi:protein-S-isoprenylcysteine O-methyltransferase Ste14
LVWLQVWSLALLRIVTLITHCGVMLREEEYLEQKFGAAYVRYRHRVNRWL